MDTPPDTFKSICPGKCSIGKDKATHPNIVAEIEQQLISGISVQTIAEYARTRYRDVGLDIDHIPMYKRIYNHKKHMTEPLAPPAKEFRRIENLKRDPNNPSQERMSNPDYVAVTVQVPRAEVDKFRAIVPKESLSAQMQRIEREIEAIDEKLAALPPGEVGKYPVLHNFKLKYSAEYRQLTALAMALKDATEESQGVSYQEFNKWMKQKKDESKPPEEGAN